MRTLSAAYLAAAKAAGRYPNIYAIIYGDNSTLTITGKDAIISAKITRGDTAKPAYFEVGRAISSSASVTVDRRRIADESLIVSGAKIEIYAEFDTAAGAVIASEKLATMYISGYDDQETDLGIISAVDYLVYTGVDFNPDGLTYPVLCSALLSEAFTQAGLSGVSMTLPCDPHVNSAPYKGAEPVADGMSGDPYTCRDIIAKIAGMQMSDIFIDADGAPKVYDYGNFVTSAVTDDLTLARRVGSETFEIHTVTVYKTSERMAKSSTTFEKLPYGPRFEDMDDPTTGTWLDEIRARAHIFVQKDWTTATVTIAGVGELEPGDFVEIGTDAIPIFISGIVYNFEGAHFSETLYSFAYTLEEYYAAPPKATQVTTGTNPGTGGGGVGEDLGNGNERFNDYDDNTVTYNGSYHHIEGKQNTAAAGQANHLGGYNNFVGGTSYSDVSGSGNDVRNAYNVTVAGDANTISGGYCGAEFGKSNQKTSCNYTISGGTGNTMSSADNCLVVGGNNNVTGDGNVVGGFDNTVPNHYNLVVGAYNNANGSNSNIVAGESNRIYGTRSLVVGYQNGDSNTPISPYDSIVCGYGHKGGITYGIVCGQNADLSYNTGNRIVVGNGTGGTASNCFRVDNQGNVYATVYNTSGADYAEYFEWADGNADGEDRRGLLVQLVGDKIAPAHGDGILGVVSARPSVVGNAYEDEWHGKYKRDIFGDYIRDENGKRQLSDDYDPEREYIPRSKRPEWAAVGMIGRLIIRDNGKCQPGGYVTARQGIGYPTLSETRARCLRRIDASHVEILIR